MNQRDGAAKHNGGAVNRYDEDVRGKTNHNDESIRSIRGVTRFCTASVMAQSQLNTTEDAVIDEQRKVWLSTTPWTTGPF